VSCLECKVALDEQAYIGNTTEYQQAGLEHGQVMNYDSCLRFEAIIQSHRLI
jgi:hypothetical protein